MSLGGPISLDDTIVAIRDQVSCDLADEAVVLSLKDGVYYGLNPVAARVWELIQEPRSLREIRDRLLEEFDVEDGACTQDLLALLVQLREWNLVELRNGSLLKP